MAKDIRFSKNEVARMWLALIPSANDVNFAEVARKRMQEVEKATIHPYAQEFIRCCEIYAETKLTDDDLSKIAKIDTEIATEQAKIKAKKDKILKSKQKALAAALESGEFGKVAQLTLEVEQSGEKQSGKEREQIRVLQKQKNGIQNKKILAVERYLSENGWLSSEKDEETSSGNQYSFDHDFIVESTLKTSGFSFDLAYNYQSRSLWIKPDTKNAVADWHGVIDLGTWSFASFLPDLGGKNRVTSRKRLCQVQYHWINAFVRGKPKNLQEVRNLVQNEWNTLRNGNWSGKFSSGSNHAMRLVETLHPSAEDYGHQRLYEIYPDLPWRQENWEEILKSITELEEKAVDDEIAAESAGDPENAEETAKSEQNSEEDDSPAEETVEPAQKAA